MAGFGYQILGYDGRDSLRRHRRDQGAHRPFPAFGYQNLGYQLAWIFRHQMANARTACSRYRGIKISDIQWPDSGIGFSSVMAGTVCAGAAETNARTACPYIISQLTSHD